MSDPKIGEAPPEDPEAKAEHMKNINDQAREVPTRPGWIAGLAVVAFLGGFVVYMTVMT